MTIRWTKEHLVRFTEEFRHRTGFNPPPRVHPFDRSEVDYIEALSDDELKAIGSAVQKETKGLYNGYPDDNIIEPVEKALREKFPFKPTANGPLIENEPNYPFFKFMSNLRNQIKAIEKVGSVLIDGITLAGDSKANNALLIANIYSLYDNIITLYEEQTPEVAKEVASLVDAAALHTLHYTGYANEVYRTFFKLKNEWDKRRPKTPEEIAEIAERQRLSDEEWEFEEDKRIEEMGTIEGQYDALVDEYIEEQKKVVAYEAILEEITKILDSNESDPNKIAELEEKLFKIQQSNRDITSSKYVNNAGWRPSDRENIRLLTQVAKPEGHSFPVHFRGNNHFKRNLCLRYGINLTNRDQQLFHCERIAWANNYWGTFKGYEDKGEVIISLWVNGQNKGEADVPDFDSDDAYDYFFDYNISTKTTLVPKQHGDKYLELERRYAPLSADFTGYHVEQLLEAHKLIMGELHK